MKKRLSLLAALFAVVLLCSSCITLYTNDHELALVKDDEIRQARVDEYAKLVASCVYVQKGDRVVITASTLQSSFATLIAQKCYELGAIGVRVLYSDAHLANLQAKYLKDTEYDGYYYDSALAYNVQGAMPYTKLIHIDYENFGNNKPTFEESSNYRTTSKKKREEFLKEHDLWIEPKNSVQGLRWNDVPWVAISYPTYDWAQKVYPELSAQAAYNKLLDDLLDFARIGYEEDFMQHEEKITALANKANELGIVELHYQSKTADLRVPLHKNNAFLGGNMQYGNEKPFNPNVPSEEIYSMPSKFGATGTVSATRPLVYKSALIEGLSLTFLDGKLVDFTATSGGEYFQTILDESPDGVYLGEAAIVSIDSPIFQTEKVYYTILLDENAGAHIAVGNAYDTNLKPGAKPDDDTNVAPYHVDITIGSEDLTVTATLEDGSKIDLLKEGKWNF